MVAPSSAEPPVYPASRDTGIPSRRRAPPLPGRRRTLPYQTPRAPVSIESRAPIPPHLSDRNKSIRHPTWPLLAAAPGPGCAGGFIGPPSAPTKTRGREIFPRLTGAPDSPEAAGYTHRERLGVFFLIGKGLCWERSRFPGLAAKPTGTAAGTGGWGGDEMQAPKSTVPGGWWEALPSGPRPSGLSAG